MCERFCINGFPISKETYLKHHDKVWSRLQAIKQLPSNERPPYITRWPGFFHFLTLVAFSLFLEEDVDVVVLEVGMGGRLDCTNVIEHPLTTGITLIDLEHTAVLGSTLQAIAREKGGIFKQGAPAVVLRQNPVVLETLQECANEVRGWCGSETTNRVFVGCGRFLLLACVLPSRTPSGPAFVLAGELRGGEPAGEERAPLFRDSAGRNGACMCGL